MICRIGRTDISCQVISITYQQCQMFRCDHDFFDCYIRISGDMDTAGDFKFNTFCQNISVNHRITARNSCYQTVIIYNSHMLIVGCPGDLSDHLSFFSGFYRQLFCLSCCEFSSTVRNDWLSRQRTGYCHFA